LDKFIFISFFLICKGGMSELNAPQFLFPKDYVILSP
jgi:hypothetical protein